MTESNVLIVGGGFGGVACALELAKHDVHVTLFDQNNYHQFQPLLYQVATAQIAAYDIARPLHGIFRKHDAISVERAAVRSIDPKAGSVTTEAGNTSSGDYVVIAAGARANFFGTPGAAENAFPLYSLND